MTKLKQCPFCPDGGEPEIVGFGKQSAKYFFGMAEMAKRVVCVECGSSSGLFDNEEEAIQAWNTRVENTTAVKIEKEDYFEKKTCMNCGYSYRGFKWEVTHLDYEYCPQCGYRLVE